MALMGAKRAAEWGPGPLDREAGFLVAGRGGLVGSALWDLLGAEGFANRWGPRSTELDLRDRDATFAWFEQHQPRYVVDSAARVGGIAANATHPYEFISDNLRIQSNLLDASLEFGVERFLFLASACVYPKVVDQPIREDSVLTGPLEKSNAAYAVAKLAGLQQVRAAREQFGLPWISAMPTNIYGPGDNFSIENSHVLPAMVRRYVDAADSGRTSVTNWGTGTPTREFVHSRDLASASLFLLENYDGPDALNVGLGADLPLRDLAAIIARRAGYEGETTWDHSRPDGTPRRQLDVSRLTALGWTPTVSLDEGIAELVAWYRAHRGHLRDR